MSVTLIGAVLGFGSSLFPKVLDYFQDRKDKKHELDLLTLQLSKGHQNKIEEINIQADIAESQALYRHDSKLKGSPWVENLRASVRPIVTYWFMLIFSFVKLCQFYLIAREPGMFLMALEALWDEPTQGIFAAVISFWFGSRMMSKRR
jgi:hypothetical protein